jgi:hypothetical protein
VGTEVRANFGYTYEFVAAKKSSRVSMLDSSRRGVDLAFIRDIHTDGFGIFAVILGERTRAFNRAAKDFR